MMMFRLITFCLDFMKMLMFATAIVLSFHIGFYCVCIDGADRETYIGYVKSKSKFDFVFVFPLLRFHK